ncbi:OLC1v1032946C1 [Oldenlandia corymbosa var. corymbosa]|uniref:OLC1v1032946C1 n=1 Tax=Oldenlandia corymbosa var. corymbosa TaxID=529605 RepID=A0AAV1CQ81_OLDCO|nr:OLC1v1032946C1 [Oldenlandia corymbosa var. corymbosa]
MDEMKDKMKGFMKKVNNPFTSSSSSSGGFKGQGRVLGSASNSNSVPTNPPILSRPSPLVDSKPNPKPSVSSQRLSSDLPDKKVESKAVINGNSNEIRKPKNGFDPFDSLITSGKRNVNGYDLKVVECPVCGRGFGSEDEVSGHIEDCLSVSGLSIEEVEKKFQGDGDDDGRKVAKSEVEVSVGAYISGKPSEVSKEVLLKLLKNVVREPDNVKFRKIRLGNPKIKEAISDVAGAVELLESVGFQLNEDGGEMWAVMDDASEKQLGLIKDAISLLEPKKVVELPSVAPSMADEQPLPLKEIDRQIRVFFSVSETVAARIEVPDSFYNLSSEELRREAQMRRKQIEDSQLLIPRSLKEKQAKAARKRYKKALIRVQFPDGVVLQGVFLPSESTAALYDFVSSALKEPSLEFDLRHPVLIKRRVIPRFPEAGKKVPTLEEEDLVPAALIKFRPIETDSVVFTGLRSELLETCEPLVPDSAAHR